MTKNPELFGDEPAQTYHVVLSEEEKILPIYNKKKKPANRPFKGSMRAIYRNRKRIIRRLVQLLIFIIIIYSVFTVYKLTLHKRAPLCTTKSCQRTEKEILESLDFDVHPCKNFYKFVCGNWAKQHPIPQDSVDTSVIQIAQNKMTDRISQFLKQSNSPNEPPVVHEIRKFYKSCMKTGRSDGISKFQEIAKILKQVQLPVAPELKKKSMGFSWLRTAVLSKKLFDKNFFFEFDVTMDPKNHSFNRILITKPISGNLFSSFRKMDKKLFDRKFIHRMVDEADFKDFMKNPYYRLIRIAFVFAYKEANIKWTEDIERIFNTNFVFLIFFSSTLDHTASLFPDDERHLPRLYSIDDLQNLTNRIFERRKGINPINWRQYLTLMFQDTNVTLDFENKDKLILISHVEYLKEVFKLMAMSPEYTIEIYMWWEIVRSALPFITSKLHDHDNKFMLRTAGIVNKPRSKFCADITNNLYGFATAHFILGDKSIKNELPKVTDMVNNIQWQFRKTIENLDWLDDKTKTKAIRKLDTMTTKVGYPEWMGTKENYNKYYENTTCSEDNFLENVSKLKRLQFKWKLMYYRLRNEDEADGWYSKFVLQTNAFYVMERNALIIPAGIFPFPFYQSGLAALNYGAIGMIIGHEFTHGFDNTGKEFDEFGRINSWWSNNTETEYKKRARCFIKEYDKYNNMVIHLRQTSNGTVTLNENIADNGGLQIAYRAYKDFMRRNGPGYLLPGLNSFTPEQLFFISFAHTWCEHRSYSDTGTDPAEPHSPYAIRVLGSLRNFPEFADVWQCKKGSPMNPNREKCQLW